VSRKRGDSRGEQRCSLLGSAFIQRRGQQRIVGIKV